MCSSCPMSMMTLKDGIERVVKEEVPEVVSVIQA
jgi:Fe-S cluster biogenesis protein NfuA